MAKYYEETKSNYARDIDHLMTFNKNGLWIENLEEEKIITAKKPEGKNLINLTIFHLDGKYNLFLENSFKKIKIESNNWKLEDVSIFKPENGILETKSIPEYQLNSIYNYEKITTLFRNFDTMSF